MAKKDKREINKRRSKALDKTKKKRTLRLIKSRPKPQPQIVERPGLPHMGAPEGFRSISMSQAMIEYAEPLMQYCEDDEKNFQAVMQAATVLWNYSVSLKQGEKDKKIEKDLLHAISAGFGLERSEADALVTKMVERYRYLFPEDKQPEPRTPFMFIRKDVRHLIKPFDYEKLTISDEIIPPDEDEREFIKRIQQLDSYINDGADYSFYEKFFFSLQDESRKLFEKWLVAKGLKNYAEDFSFCPDIYLNFIYAYIHDEIIILNSIPPIYFVEFFEDYLLRKMMVKPHEYISWPPALKLFYQFLHEKGYLDNHKEMIGEIDVVEPYFIEVLRKQFS